MILVTVGAQMPFDRLVGAVDDWAGLRGRSDVVAQLGPSDYQARHLRTVRMFPPDELRRLMEKADAVVAHAGMGTILTALELGKPLLVMPRLGRLRETRNDHQVATARHFADAGKLLAAADETELAQHLDRVERFRPGLPISDRASDALLHRVRDFVLAAEGR